MCDGGGGRVGLVVELEKRVETEQRRVLLPNTRTPSALYDNVRVQEQQRVETRTAHSHMYTHRHTHTRTRVLMQTCTWAHTLNHAFRCKKWPKSC